MNLFKSGVKNGVIKSGFNGGNFAKGGFDKGGFGGGLLTNGLDKSALPSVGKKTKSDGLIKGALVISMGGFITKILGAFYRVPLTNILGAEGLGLYQAVFPIYCLLLTLSSTGGAERRFKNHRRGGGRVFRP